MHELKIYFLLCIYSKLKYLHKEWFYLVYLYFSPIIFATVIFPALKKW